MTRKDVESIREAVVRWDELNRECENFKSGRDSLKKMLTNDPNGKLGGVEARMPTRGGKITMSYVHLPMRRALFAALLLPDIDKLIEELEKEMAEMSLEESEEPDA